jgi:Domain of unknown function (DUF4259)
MGSWGTGAFDNDTACDWAFDLEGAVDLSLVEATFERVLGIGNAYLEADVACEALAACEVVARLKGNWGSHDVYTETVDRWVEAHRGTPSQALIARALAAIDRVLSPASELLESWKTSADTSAWHEAVRDLRSRVAR